MERFLLAASVATITIVLSRSRLFRPTRLWLRAIPFIGELIGCTFCTSIWVSAAHVAVFKRGSLFVMAVEVFAIAAISAPMAWLLYHAHGDIPNHDSERK